MKQFLKKIVEFFIPPEEWRLYVIFILGIFTGLIFLILHISNATSYLSDKPETCINCHVMIPQFSTWQHSSHKNAATCNDCHVPQNNFISKYMFKASDGLRHSTMFTFRLEPQVMKIKEAGINVVQNNCIRCHNNLIHKTELVNMDVSDQDLEEKELCWNCHREVPHGTVTSLSSTPFALVPRLNPIMPQWLNEYLTKTKADSIKNK